MNIWLVMLLGGLLTFGMRLSFILFSEKINIPPLLKRGLHFVPPAVLSGIIFPELFLHSGSFDLSWHNGRLIAGVIAIVVAWKTKNAMLTIIIGMLALILFKYFVEGV